jgi:type I restriction-modification system DNA methylase subunit
MLNAVDGKIVKTNDDPENDIRLLSYLKNSQPLIEKYTSGQFKGCFGVMSVIHSIILDYFVEKYDLFKLLEHVNMRKLRMNVERVFGVISSVETSNNVGVICGDIFSHLECYELKFDTYKDLVNSLEFEEMQRTKNLFKLKSKNPLLDYPIFKVWTGR